MSTANRGGTPPGVSEYRTLPAGGGRSERWRLIWLAILCAFPLLTAIFQILFVASFGTPNSATGILGIVVGLAELAVIGAQVLTMVRARSAISGDQVHLPAIARSKRIMSVFSVPVLVAGILLALIEAFSGFGIGIGSLFVILVGIFGFVARYRLRRIELWGRRGVALPPYTGRGMPPAARRQ